MKSHLTVDQYIAANPEWEQSLIILRKIILATKLKETVKWGVPVYTYDGKNIVGLAAFKSYVGLWFYQGALLSDKHKMLVNAQEGKTKAMRQWRFQSEEEIEETLILEYIDEAIQNQKAGKEIKPKKKPLVIPDELREVLNNTPHLKSSFNQLGLTKQREFADYISEAKREETKMKRLDKIIPLILEHKGLHDKYK
jgi:uncharacterized protein YdeI (YjbR/CyaY-like superfamily)